jgi:hypothetical protein
MFPAAALAPEPAEASTDPDNTDPDNDITSKEDAVGLRTSWAPDPSEMGTCPL